jgi:hypothetical protein
VGRLGARLASVLTVAAAPWRIPDQSYGTSACGVRACGLTGRAEEHMEPFLRRMQLLVSQGPEKCWRTLFSRMIVGQRVDRRQNSTKLAVRRPPPCCVSRARAERDGRSFWKRPTVSAR